MANPSSGESYPPVNVTDSKTGESMKGVPTPVETQKPSLPKRAGQKVAGLLRTGRGKKGAEQELQELASEDAGAAEASLDESWIKERAAEVAAGNLTDEQLRETYSNRPDLVERVLAEVHNPPLSEGAQQWGAMGPGDHLRPRFAPDEQFLAGQQGPTSAGEPGVAPDGETATIVEPGAFTQPEPTAGAEATPAPPQSEAVAQEQGPPPAPEAAATEPAEAARPPIGEPIAAETTPSVTTTAEEAIAPVTEPLASDVVGGDKDLGPLAEAAGGTGGTGAPPPKEPGAPGSAPAPSEGDEGDVHGEFRDVGGGAETTAGTREPHEAAFLTKDELDFYNSALGKINNNQRLSPADADRFTELSRVLATGTRTGGRPAARETGRREAVSSRYDLGFSADDSFVERKFTQIASIPDRSLPRELANVNRAIELRNRKISNPRTPDNEYYAAYEDLDVLNDLKAELERTMNEKSIPIEQATGGVAAPSKAAEAAIAQGKERGKEMAEIYKMRKSPEELKAKSIELQSEIDSLRDLLEGKSGAEAKAIQNQIDHLTRLKDRVDKLKPKAKDRAKQKKEKTKEESIKAKSKTNTEELDSLFLAENEANPTEIGKELAKLKGTYDARGQLTADGELQTLQNAVNAETDPKKKAELTEQLIELRKRIQKYETAMKDAKKRESAKKGSAEGIGPDTIKQYTAEEFVEMSPEDRAKYLRTLGRVFPIGAEFNSDRYNQLVENLKDKLIKGGPEVSAKDEAQFVEAIGDLLIKRGRRAIDMKDLEIIGSKYPEVGMALADKLAQSEAAKELRKKVPSNWEKLTKYAKSKPGLLMLLLMLLVGAFGVGKVAMGQFQGGHQV